MLNERSGVAAGANVVYSQTALPFEANGELTGDCRTDVVVVGGGFTGVSAALNLARQGHAVILVEAQAIGWGASGRNGGQVNAGLKFEPKAIEEKFGSELGGRMVQLSSGAPDRVFSLIEEFGIECEADRRGTIRAAFSSGSADYIRKATEDLQQRGAPVSLLDASGMQDATGTQRYLLGAIDRRGGSVNPLAYVRGLAAAASKAGAMLHERTPATALARDADGWTVTTPKARIRTGWVVLATNGYTDDLWPKLRQTIVPVYGGIIASEPLPSDVASRIMPGRQVLYEHESITVYYRMDKAGRFLIGGRSKLKPLDGPAHFRDLMNYTQRLWPFLDNVRWSHGWNGQLAITTDAYLHLNEPAPNLIACLGYNGRGIAMATAMGGEIARRIAGAPAEELDMPVTPMLPIPLHRFWPIGASIRIAYGRFRTRFGL